ncbi:hypothetical protein K3495_g10896 [Podosphaera aphanis]|nr:hypothetical protein K3495_g10896 [Podosphaera aphanis]
MPRLNMTTRDQIIQRLKEGKSCRSIASELKCSKSTVSKLLKTLPEESSARKRGGVSKLTPRDKRRIVNNIANRIVKTPKQAAAGLQASMGISVTPQTVRNVLRESDLKAKKKPKKPALTTRHRKARLDFSLRHKEWTIEDWKKVVWSDETKINRICSDGINYTRQKDKQLPNDSNTIQIVKFGGGNVMIWACMTWSGPCHGSGNGKDGHRTVHHYFRPNLICSMEATCLLGDMPPVDQLIFQQDNDPKHTARATKVFLRSKKITCLDWPAQSPDLNPIEHLWGELKRRLGRYDEYPKGVGELWERIKNEWSKVPLRSCQNLIESMPKRIEAVVAAKGGNTRY